MARRFLSLSIIIILIFLGKHLLFGNKRERISQREFLDLLNSEGPESLLAMGFKLSLRDLDKVDLEFIPGLSEDSKSKLLLKKDEIRASAKNLPPEKKHKALFKVKGIGAKKALDIYEILSLD